MPGVTIKHSATPEIAIDTALAFCCPENVGWLSTVTTVGTGSQIDVAVGVYNSIDALLTACDIVVSRLGDAGVIGVNSLDRDLLAPQLWKPGRVEVGGCIAIASRSPDPNSEPSKKNRFPERGDGLESMSVRRSWQVTQMYREASIVLQSPLHGDQISQALRFEAPAFLAQQKIHAEYIAARNEAKRRGDEASLATLNRYFVGRMESILKLA